MDTDSYIQLITIIILLFLSAFFSSAETAFMTVSRIKIRSLMDEGNRHAALVAKIIDNSGKMLSAVLIGNNIVNISCSALATTFTINVWGSYATGIATGVLTLFVLIFGEITPKNLASKFNTKLVLLYAPVIYGLMIILTPVIFIVDHLAGIVLKLFGTNSKDKSNTITEEELRTIVKVSHEEGIIEKDERQIIDNLFDFGDTSVKDVMIPRIDMTVADVNSSYDDIITLFKSTMYTRIPIYENDTDNVIGTLNIKDLIVTNVDDSFNIRKIMREPFFTYEHKNTSELFKEMQLKRYSIAIVLDEYGQTAGLVTMEDILEEIVGNILDEHDEEDTYIEKKPDGTFVMNGMTPLEEVGEALNLDFEDEDYDTLNGLLISLIDKIPSEHEVFEVKYKGYIFEVLSVEDKMIKYVHVVPERSESAESDTATCQQDEKMVE